MRVELWLVRQASDAAPVGIDGVDVALRTQRSVMGEDDLPAVRRPARVVGVAREMCQLAEALPFGLIVKSCVPVGA
jgi:hypothetical protein